MNFPKLTQHGSYLIHSGDYESGYNTEEQSWNIAINFFEWMGRQKFTHKIFVAGNHDASFFLDPEKFAAMAAAFGVTVLDSEVKTFGKIRIFGSPYLYTHRRNSILVDYLPDVEDYDILVTHVPPKGIFDFAAGRKENIGSQFLRDYVQNNKVKLCIFGHCHEGRGSTGPFHNVAVTGRGKAKVLVNDPKLIDITYVLNKEG